MFKPQKSEPEIYKNQDGTFSVRYFERVGWFSKKTFYLCHKEDAMEVAAKDQAIKAIANRKDCESAHWNDCLGEFNFERELTFKSETQAKIGLSVFEDVQRQEAFKKMAKNLTSHIRDLQS